MPGMSPGRRRHDGRVVGWGLSCCLRRNVIGLVGLISQENDDQPKLYPQCQEAEGRIHGFRKRPTRVDEITGDSEASFVDPHRHTVPKDLVNGTSVNTKRKLDLIGREEGNTPLLLRSAAAFERTGPVTLLRPTRVVVVVVTPSSCSLPTFARPPGHSWESIRRWPRLRRRRLAGGFAAEAKRKRRGGNAPRGPLSGGGKGGKAKRTRGGRFIAPAAHHRRLLGQAATWASPTPHWLKLFKQVSSLGCLSSLGRPADVFSGNSKTRASRRLATNRFVITIIITGAVDCRNLNYAKCISHCQSSGAPPKCRCGICLMHMHTTVKGDASASV